MEIEYRVKPVTRFIVTRFYSDGTSGGVEECGEYRNEKSAHDIATALCQFEQQSNSEATVIPAKAGVYVNGEYVGSAD